MAQESRGRRSFGYRSFITCEDPRGVVESGTIRKPKHGKKPLESDRSKHRNLHSVGGEEAQNPASFRLLEVSRGAQKLNNVISSWSNGHSRKNSREIAQDMLKGALDIGELSMLSRLQQSSNNMLESTKKQQKQKIERDSFEDIKKVILDGVGRSDPSSEEACDGPSTSSSQSSIVHSSKFVPPASKKKNKTTKRSNLIAKLMGLEETSLRSLSYNPRNHMGDHDPEESSGWKRRPALAKMIEAVKSKGLPKRWSDVVSDDRPPIIILRPLTFSCLNLEQPVIPKSRAEVFEEMFLGMRTRTNPLAQTDECEPLNSVKEKTEAKEAKPKEVTSSHGKSRPHKKQLVDRIKGGDDMKVSMLQSATAKYGRRGAKNTGTSEKNWPENIPKAVTKNGNQRYRDEYGELDINRGRESLLQLSDPARITEDASQIEITDYDDYDQSSASETPLLFSNHMNKESALTIMDACGGIDQDKGSHSSTIIRPIGGGNVCCKDNHSPSSRVTASLGSIYPPSGPCIDRLKDLLLSSQPFIKRVEALFDSKVNPDTYLLQQVNNNVDHNNVSARELLDTANELVELHGFRCSRACLPPLPWTTHKTSSITCYHYSSLEQLLDQVCDEIEALRCNREDEGDNHSTDTFLLLVKGDLKSTGMVGGVWDMGWTSTGSADQLEEITRGVDELLLDGLIEEILVDLSL